MNTFKDRVAETTLEKFKDENVPWLLIGIPNRDPFFARQYLERHFASSGQRMKKFTSLFECLHVMMQMLLATTFLLIAIGFMNIQEDTHRGEKPATRKFTTAPTNHALDTRTLSADGTLRRRTQNQMKKFLKQRVSSLTVGKSK